MAEADEGGGSEVEKLRAEVETLRQSAGNRRALWRVVAMLLVATLVGLVLLSWSLRFSWPTVVALVLLMAGIGLSLVSALQEIHRASRELDPKSPHPDTTTRVTATAMRLTGTAVLGAFSVWVTGKLVATIEALRDPLPAGWPPALVAVAAIGALVAIVIATLTALRRFLADDV